MDDARADRLQPYYIELAFKEAFTRFGGQLVDARRDATRSRRCRSTLKVGRHGPIASRYERVTFGLDFVQPEGLVRADLVAPGHPLHDAVMEQTVSSLAGVLNRGAVLVSSTLEEPKLLVGVIEEVVDATGASVSRRFGYAFVDESGAVIPAGPAPYLDSVAAPRSPATECGARRCHGWPRQSRGRSAGSSSTSCPSYLSEIQPRRTAELDKQATLVRARLKHESERLILDAMVAGDKERLGEKPKESADSLSRKAADMQARLDRRLELIDQQRQMSTKPPLVVSAALVLPVSMVDADLPAEAPVRAKETKSVERRAVELVLASERVLGRVPEEQAFNNPGYDVLSTDPFTGDTYRIEVKGRLAGAEDFWVTHTEVITGKNAAPRYRLALVSVHPEGAHGDDVRYLDDPFANVEMGDFEATGHKGHWAKSWAKGRSPF